MNYTDKPCIFLDIDGVLALPKQYYSKKTNVFGVYNFDKKCVDVLNQIIDVVQPYIILSSDWKLHYDFDTMNNILSYNGIKLPIVAVTPSLWGSQFTSLSQLDECRASEIIKFVNKHGISNYVAIDDLRLHDYLDENHFVHCSQTYEGIKQTNIKEKIINKLK